MPRSLVMTTINLTASLSLTHIPYSQNGSTLVSTRRRGVGLGLRPEKKLTKGKSSKRPALAVRNLPRAATRAFAMLGSHVEEENDGGGPELDNGLKTAGKTGNKPAPAQKVSRTTSALGKSRGSEREGGEKERNEEAPEPAKWTTKDRPCKKLNPSKTAKGEQ